MTLPFYYSYVHMFKLIHNGHVGSHVGGKKEQREWEKKIQRLNKKFQSKRNFKDSKHIKSFNRLDKGAQLYLLIF